MSYTPRTFFENRREYGFLYAMRKDLNNTHYESLFILALNMFPISMIQPEIPYGLIPVCIAGLMYGIKDYNEIKGEKEEKLEDRIRLVSSSKEELKRVSGF